MKNKKAHKINNRMMLILAFVGLAVGVIIIIVVLVGYIDFSAGGFHYNGVKIGGSVLSQQLAADFYVLLAASVLAISSLVLLLRIVSKNRRK